MYVVDVIESDPTTRRLSETGNFLDDSGGGNNNGGLGLVLPDVIVTKRNRSDSVVGRIEDDVERGAVKYFCRSRGHGFIVPENVSWCGYWSVFAWYHIPTYNQKQIKALDHELSVHLAVNAMR